MKSVMKFILCFLLLQSFAFANTLKILSQDEFENSTLSIASHSYQVLDFNKSIQNIKLTDSTKIMVEFLETKNSPFTRLKVLAKATGTANAFVTFNDNSVMQLNFNIVPNLQSLIALTQKEYPTIKISQINDTIILEGTVQAEKDKNKIFDIFKKANIDSDKKIINLLTTINPTKMVKVKLYVVEINNEKGRTIKNNWSLTGSNSDLSANITSTMLNSVTLSGGITAIANTLGNDFNVGLTLNYLQNNSVAKILDETTLITLEKNKSQFHAGGILNVKVSSTETAQLEKIEYGLKMEVEVQEIVNDQYIKLLIRTESSVLDTLNVVDGIPSTKNKTVDTNVIVDDKSTVVLGGLINIEEVDTEEKIPLLSDIPVVGRIFTSTDKHSDDIELMFFITPEIVDPAVNNQKKILQQKSKFKNDRVLK